MKLIQVPKYLYQKGALLISAVIIIVIVGLLAAVVTYIAVINARSTFHQVMTTRAFFVAEGGLRRILYSMTNGLISCADINGHPDFTDVSFGNGRFTVTSTNYNPTPSATLTATIGPAEQIIPISDFSGYASVGRVIIDSEAIDYTSTSNNPSTCLGFPPCLVGLTRGAASTTPTIHVIGRGIAQNMCHIASEGGVPNLTDPRGKRQLSEDVSIGFGGGWMVGDNYNGETILGWNGSQWMRMGPYADVPDVRLNSVVIVGLQDAWAVGYRSGGSANIIHWDGNAWSSYPAGDVPNEELFDITCVNADDCWVVGEKATFAHFDGSEWEEEDDVEGVPTNKPINSISCMASNNCWSVGNYEGDKALVVHWDGDEWSRVIVPVIPKENLNSIDCIGANDCWVVGDKATFVHYHGPGLTDWTQYTASGVSSTTAIHDVSCVSSKDCWAVGQSDGGETLFVRWDGTGWSRVTVPGIPNVQLKAVGCADSDNCWATNKADSMMHWNGSNWAHINPGPSVPNVNLNSIAFSSTVHVFGRLYRVRE